ncbi:MAG: SdrD B-like domain-containing protein [Actinomycetota bacterium]|nr:SdrD B-like domain-containing protein [Actinomycetota bacterium]
MKPGRYEVGIDESTAPPGSYPATPNPVPLSLGCGEEARVWFGNATGGSICGYKFLDEDCDGMMDEGEDGIDGVKVCLSMPDGNDVAIAENTNNEEWCTETKGGGCFCFDGLMPGSYVVTVDESTVPEGHYPTSPNPLYVDLGCGEARVVYFGNAEYGSLSGYKYEDMMADGSPDGDPGWEDVTIQLKQGEDVIATTTTDSEGRF